MSERNARPAARAREGDAAGAGPAAEAALDFGVLPELIGYHVRRAQVRVFQHFAATMSELRITPGQFSVLVLVEANPGISQRRLADAIGIDKSTAAPLLDGMRRRGLLARTRSPADRRCWALSLTRRGQGLLRRAVPRVRAHERQLARAMGLDAATRRGLIALLQRLHQAPPLAN